MLLYAGVKAMARDGKWSAPMCCAPTLGTAVVRLPTSLLIHTPPTADWPWHRPLAQRRRAFLISLEVSNSSHSQTLVDSTCEEIRNHIYGQVPHLAHHPFQLVRPIPTSTKSKALGPSIFTRATSNRIFLGLTRTCRQLRIEFLPIYMGSLRVSLYPPDVYDYLNVFIFCGTLIDDIERVAARLFIVHNQRLANVDCTFKLDITPLIRLHKRSPKFIVEYEGAYLPRDRSMRDIALRELMYVHANKKRSEYFDEAVSKVLVEPNYGFFLMEIVTRSEFQEPWMGIKYHKLDNAYRQLRDDWIRKRGLSLRFNTAETYCFEVEFLVGKARRDEKQLFSQTEEFWRYVEGCAF